MERDVMPPVLIIIAGPYKGKSFTLTEEDFHIGRDPSNHLCIRDRAVSRHHSSIMWDGEKYQIHDLNSHNGTFVNELPVKERCLQHGDQIQVGGNLVVFLCNDAQSSLSDRMVQFDNMEEVVPTVQLRLDEAFNSSSRELTSLARISMTINAAKGLAELQRQLLSSIFEIVPAERGAIMLVEQSLDQPRSIFTLDRSPGSKAPLIISRTATQHVWRERVAILCSNTSWDDTLSASTSLTAAPFHSLLCVPIMLFEHVSGVIYIVADEARGGFTERDLKILTIIAGMTTGVLERAHYVEWLESENQRLQKDLQIEHNMIGESPRMREVYQLIAKVAPTDSTVLVLGESGTGKELAARAIHQNSSRTNKPFLAVNCAALTDTLLESELFGYERGAFTGAISQKKGKLEVADGGTVFLDEIGELPLLLQAKLLRVLQQREFERVGGTRSIKVDIRIIAATNRHLIDAVNAGSFRQDLYYRLNVVEITMPPLRAREDDVLLLANYFVAKYSGKCKRRVMGIAAGARQNLLRYDWPGNVRELENMIERAIVLGSAEQIVVEDLPEAILNRGPSNGQEEQSFKELVKNTKKRIILNTIKNSQGNYTEAAKRLGMHQNNLHRLIRSLNLEVKTKK